MLISHQCFSTIPPLCQGRQKLSPTALCKNHSSVHLSETSVLFLWQLLLPSAPGKGHIYSPSQKPLKASSHPLCLSLKADKRNIGMMVIQTADFKWMDVWYRELFPAHYYCCYYFYCCYVINIPMHTPLLFQESSPPLLPRFSPGIIQEIFLSYGKDDCCSSILTILTHETLC